MLAENESCFFRGQRQRVLQNGFVTADMALNINNLQHKAFIKMLLNICSLAQVRVHVYL